MVRYSVLVCAFSVLLIFEGIVHVVNHPVLPPVSAFQTLFLLPQYFSIAVSLKLFNLPFTDKSAVQTSAIQRVGLTDDLDLHFHCKDRNVDDCKFSGASSLTFFAPVNVAFERLPFKLRLFLFSPAGSRILKKILQYHIVPDVVVLSGNVPSSVCEGDIILILACRSSVQ